MGKRGRQRQRKAVAPRQSTRPLPRNDPIAVVRQQVEQQVIAQRWQGPIPDPDSLKKYKEIDRGLPDRIVAMAERTLDLTERQTNHRIEVERRLHFGMNLRAHIGLWMGLFVFLVLAGLSFAAIFEGHDTAGTTIMTIDIVGLVGVFVYGRYDQARQERRRTE